MCICALIFILIEPSYLCVKKLKPYDTGATKNNCKESNGIYAKIYFCCLRMIFFFLHLKGQLGTSYYFQVV